jgi:hypothetical protein
MEFSDSINVATTTKANNSPYIKIIDSAPVTANIRDKVTKFSTRVKETLARITYVDVPYTNTSFNRNDYVGRSFVGGRINTSCNHICAECRSEILSTAIKVCGQCKVVPYCGEKCQSKHWIDEHSRTCNQ